MARLFKLFLLHFLFFVSVSAKQFKGETLENNQSFLVTTSNTSFSIQFGKEPECTASFEKKEDAFVVIKEDPSNCTPDCFNRGLTVDIDQETMYFKPHTKRCMVETAKAV